MSFIDNIKNDIEEASARYDIMTDKIMLFESVAYNDYIIKQKEAYLDAYRYGGDVEDYMTESESGSFGSKVKSTIDKMIETLKEFFEKIKEKVTEIFEKIRDTGLVKKLEEIIKANPEAANVKVEYKDNSKLLGFLHKESDNSKKRMSRAISGKVSEKDADEATESKNRVAKYIAIGTGVVAVTVTLGFLLAHLKSDGTDQDTNHDVKLFEKLRQKIDDLSYQREHKKLANNALKLNFPKNKYSKDERNEYADLYMNDLSNSELKALIDIGQTEADLEKEISKTKVTRLTNIIESLRVGSSTISNKFKKNTEQGNGENQVPPPKVDGETITSSAHEDSFDADDYFSELCNDIFGDDSSTEDDFDTMYSELCNDIFF